MSKIQENRYESIREELYRSLGITSDDSFMDKNEWVDDDSHYSFNNIVHLDEDGEIDGEYDEEVENDEEDI
ncbi:hypothetical protein CQW23_28360 [Capsicum baccatum]|uniref:Uncharacterized protein n=1 Tax=Capsicum baccatum TaxID=33114 RepID=A0A2G2VGC4_CAPBA|nr:hypothetical protein CQW23_28360 [Capsicum baccatum]